MLDASIGTLFRRAVRKYPSRIALQQGPRRVTFQGLQSQVYKLANSLTGMGVRRGDRVALLMPNSIEFVVVDLALSTLGAIKVPFNVYLSHGEVGYRLADSGARLFFVGAGLRDVAEAAVRDTPWQVTTVHVGPESALDDDVLTFANLLASGSSDSIEVNVEAADAAAIMYTGGTTGRSKGIVHTHRSFIALSLSAIFEIDISRYGTILHVTSLAHAAGLLVLPALLRGCRQIIADEFDPELFVSTVESEGVSYVLLVPSQIYSLIDTVSDSVESLGSLETILYGGAPIAPSRIAEAVSRWGPIFTQVYAQMEAALQVTVLTKRDHSMASAGERRLFSSCGRPVTIAEVRVADEDGRLCPPGEPGEVLVRGPHLMRGYWNAPQETDDALRAGWLHTGDIAKRDENDYLYIVDRKKDMIISGGMNVYSASVEKELFAHPAISEAAVIGVPSEKWGEEVKAIVVLEPGCSETPEDIIEYCRGRLSKYEVPKSVQLTDSLPLTAYGKVSKHELKQLYSDS